METKINNKTKVAVQAPSTPFKYQTGSSGWGLTGFFEGQRLVFSGVFSPRLGLTRKLPSLAGLFGAKPKDNSASIISEVDVYKLFSLSAKHAWDNSFRLAKKRRAEARVEDIFLALLKEQSVQNLLARMKVSTSAAGQFLINYLKLKPQAGASEDIQKVPFAAFELAIKLRGNKIGSLMLLGGLMNAAPEDNILQAIFTNIGLTIGKLELFTVWARDLPYDFPPNSPSAKLLYCCRQSEMLEQHFGYFFEFPAIEAAVRLSAGQTLKDLEHKKALQLLVKAGSLAQAKGSKIITESLVVTAAGAK